MNAVTALHRIAKSGGTDALGDARFSKLLETITCTTFEVLASGAAGGASRPPAVAGGLAVGTTQGPPPPRDHQNISNTLWSFALLALQDAPLLAAMA